MENAIHQYLVSLLSYLSLQQVLANLPLPSEYPYLHIPPYKRKESFGTSLSTAHEVSKDLFSWDIIHQAHYRLGLVLYLHSLL